LRSSITCILLAILSAGGVSTATAGAATTAAIGAVSVSQTSINPTSGDTAVLFVRLMRPGKVSVEVIDRDGYPIRTLALRKEAPVGSNAFRWDGRADDGSVVPDEAYSFKVDWTDGHREATYFPANSPAPMVSIDPLGYSRRSATLSYRLASPSRVHIQAGTATLNSKSRQMEGPVLKTVLNRVPRIGGRIGEYWSGYDESGAVFIPDLPNFAISIAATPLPAGSVTTFGNRSRTFLQYAATRTGSSRFTFHAAPGGHHVGLNVFDDLSPAMKVEPLNAVWSARDRFWSLEGPTLEVRISVEGPTAAAFASHPGTIYRFLDSRPLGSTTVAGSSTILRIPAGEIGAAGGLLALNWSNALGPVAVGTMRIRPAPLGKQKESQPGTTP
jgi:hypothetical protein